MFGLIKKEIGYLFRRLENRSNSSQSLVKSVDDYVNQLKSLNYYPDKYISYSGPSVKMKVSLNGKKPIIVTQFCTNNSLGFATDPDIIAASKAALMKYGSTSNSGSPALCGKIHIHEELEKEISSFKRCKFSTLFMTGWMANIAIINAASNLLPTSIPNFINDKDTIILCDHLNHASIVAGLGLTKIESMVSSHMSGHVSIKQFEHNDMEDLKKKINKYKSKHERLMIVSDAVFSMDGDIANLPEILEIAGEFNGLVVMDEAHSTGTIGETGRGIVEHYKLNKSKINSSGADRVHMTTLSKFAGGVGGCVISDNVSFNDLMHISPYHIYTSTLPPSVAASCLAAFRKLKKNPQLVSKLQKNSRYMREGLKDLGYDVRGETHIIPVVLPEKTNVTLFGRTLFEKHKLFVSAVYAFAASPRLRMTCSAMHSKDDIDLLLSVMENVGKKMNVI